MKRGNLDTPFYCMVKKKIATHISSFFYLKNKIRKHTRQDIEWNKSIMEHFLKMFLK